MGASESLGNVWDTWKDVTGTNALVDTGKSLGRAGEKIADPTKSARKKARDQATAMSDRQMQMESDLKKQQEDAANQAAAIVARDNQRKRQRAQAAGAGGRRSTVLTSPLGLTQAPDAGYKTLLGA